MKQISEYSRFGANEHRRLVRKIRNALLTAISKGEDKGVLWFIFYNGYGKGHGSHTPEDMEFWRTILYFMILKYSESEWELLYKMYASLLPGNDEEEYTLCKNKKWLNENNSNFVISIFSHTQDEDVTEQELWIDYLNPMNTENP